VHESSYVSKTLETFKLNTQIWHGNSHRSSRQEQVRDTWLVLPSLSPCAHHCWCGYMPSTDRCRYLCTQLSRACMSQGSREILWPCLLITNLQSTNKSTHDHTVWTHWKTDSSWWTFL
jgi:hypothetical protein